MRLLLIAAVLAFPASAQTSLHLVPMPREVKPASSLPLTVGIHIECAQPCDPDDAFAIADFRAFMAERGIAVTNAAAAPHIFTARFSTPLGVQTYIESLPNPPKPPLGSRVTLPVEFEPEGYAIVPDLNGARPAGLALTADTASGIFYALQTVKQLIVGDGPNAVLQLAIIRDWPAMKYRGLDDDMSRGPVDTLAFQKKVIRTIAAYKCNLYSPYFENTQQYASNPLPAPPGGSLSASDARELVAYAKPYHVMVVPEQEAFGHLRHALVYEQYQQLAETPHGAVLAPGQPGSLVLISQMFTELAALYPSPFLHIGADETVDLGVGQTKDAVDKDGLGKVYLDFMQQIDTTLRPLHRRLLFWGDIAQHEPALLKAMPAQFKQDTIAIAWEYNPNPKGFMPYLKPYTDAGFETWVSPGINNWNRVYPNYTMGLANIQQFTRDGQAIGSTGQLNTIWNDDGEALASNNWYGILFGAAAAWQPGESSIPQFEQSYAQVFHGDLTGKLNQAQLELMAAHDLLKSSALKSDGSDLLFWADPWAPDQQKNVVAVRPVLSELRLHAERALTLIAQARAAAPCQTLFEQSGQHTAQGLFCNGGKRSTTTSIAVNGMEQVQPAVYDPANAFPSNPTNLRETDAIDALELGARRFDFLGLKFQLADEIAAAYSRALAASTSTDRKIRATTGRELSDINGVNGRIQDIKDGYSLLRDLYAQSWLRTNRAYALRPVLEHYDYTIGIWLARMDKVRSAQRQWGETRTLPTAAETGIPAQQPTASTLLTH
ncbi:MAG: beta-N-acetylhexosaminidase [Acidobacteriota bacterium]|nr:beta-N-acetylhexosaminidase [Acidobacteriota bacterium]